MDRSQKVANSWSLDCGKDAMNIHIVDHPSIKSLVLKFRGEHQLAKNLKATNGSHHTWAP